MMRYRFTRVFIPALALCAALSLQAKADIMVGVEDSTAPWNGFMNWSNLPAPGGDGAFQFASPWGIADLVSSFDDGAGTLTLSPNTIGDPDPYWYIGGGGPGAPGNKIGEANLYIEETGPLAGENVVFTVNVLANTWTPAHSTRIFVSDFAPDFSSRVDSFVNIAGPGVYTASLATINDPLRHVQYGFQTTGVNVWVTDTAPFGSLVVGTIPEPGSLALLGMGALALGIYRRRR